MANADSAYGFKYKHRLSGAPCPPLHDVLLGTSAAFAKGDPMNWNAAGYLDILSTVTASPAYIAAQDVPSTVTVGTTKARMLPILPDMVFQVQCSGTPTRATYMGGVVDIEGSTGVYECNENASTNDTLRIIGYADVTGQTDEGANAQVLVVFNKTCFGTGLSA